MQKFHNWILGLGVTVGLISRFSPELVPWSNILFRLIFVLYVISWCLLLGLSWKKTGSFKPAVKSHSAELTYLGAALITWIGVCTYLALQ